MSASTVILALSSATRDGGAPAAAVARSAELGAALVAAYVIDSHTIEGLERRVSGDGFIGERPCTDLMTAALDEWRRCADDCLSEAVALAKEAGVTCVIEVTQGDWVDQVTALVDRLEAEGGTVAACVAPDFSSSALRKLLRTDEVARLRARLSCPVDCVP